MKTDCIQCLRVKVHPSFFQDYLEVSFPMNEYYAKTIFSG